MENVDHSKHIRIAIAELGNCASSFVNLSMAFVRPTSPLVRVRLSLSLQNGSAICR